MKGDGRTGPARVGLGSMIPAPVTLVAGLLLLVSGCGGPQNGEDEGGALLVSAASDLRFAFDEIAEAFREETGHQVVFNYGSTGNLAQQIRRGAPADVFAAANESFLDELVDDGLVLADTRALYARGFLVLWSRADMPAEVEAVEDLVDPGVRRVAIANPGHAPYGIAARQALQAAGVWDALGDRLILGEDVNQTFQYASTGNVDVAIVALSLALAPQHRGGRWAPVPAELHDPIDQAMGVVSSSRRPEVARAFVAFVNGPTGRPIMERYGFQLPDREEA
jgi:molybdate transport system substrate-binding protein